MKKKKNPNRIMQSISYDGLHWPWIFLNLDTFVNFAYFFLADIPLHLLQVVVLTDESTDRLLFFLFLLPAYPVDQRNFYHEISEVAKCIKIITDCNDVDTWDHKLLNKNKTLRFSIHTSPDHVVNSLTQPLTCLKPLKQKRSFEDNVHMMKAWMALQGIMCRDTLEV